MLQIGYSIYKCNLYLSKPITFALNQILMNKKIFRLVFLLCAALLFIQQINAQTNAIGIFDGQNDIGRVKHAGSGAYNSKSQVYNLSGSGANIWATHDEFHFVWRKMTGDFILRTDAAFIGKGVEEHRKIGWMVRQSLDTNSKHVSAVVHGSRINFAAIP